MASPDSPEPNLSTKSAPQLELRFDRAARLFGEEGFLRLARARVVIIGIGGVGTFTAEALARSGVGELVLVDYDRVCITNINRQLHATELTMGENKVEAMAERLRSIHPTCRITPIARHYDAQSSEEILSGNIDFVVDAIDNLTAKSHLIDACIRRGIRIISSMGAAARLDPTMVRVADLADSYKDPFAASLRKILRSSYGYDIQPGRTIGVPAVFSPERSRRPAALSYDTAESEAPRPTSDVPESAEKKPDDGVHQGLLATRLNGSASFVTGTFGLTAASLIVRELLGEAT